MPLDPGYPNTPNPGSEKTGVCVPAPGCDNAFSSKLYRDIIADPELAGVVDEPWFIEMMSAPMPTPTK